MLRSLAVLLTLAAGSPVHAASEAALQRMAAAQYRQYRQYYSRPYTGTRALPGAAGNWIPAAQTALQQRQQLRGFLQTWYEAHSPAFPGRLAYPPVSVRQPQR